MSKLGRNIIIIFLLVSSVSMVAAQEKSEDPTLVLNIGHPKLKEKTMDIEVGVIHSAASGSPLSFERMIREINEARFIYVGETHNSMPMHEIQFNVIRALYARDRNIAVGMEMLPVSAQETLNRWSAGLLTEEEFIREVRWYVHWNYHFGFYRKIFAFVKEHRLPIYALNVPREIITKIRMRGWEALSEEEKKLVPRAPDVSHEDHRTLIRTIFESTDDLPHQMKGPGLDTVFEGLYRSQSAWDEVMAGNAIKGFESEGRRIVVCAGSGHLLYNLGINRRVFEHMPAPFKTILAVVVPSGQEKVTVSRSFGDYVFGLAPEKTRAFPTIGLTFNKVDNLANLIIDRKPIVGVALMADFEKGDVVLSVDGQCFSDVNELRMFLARYNSGDEVTFKVLREGEVKDIEMTFDETREGERLPW